MSSGVSRVASGAVLGTGADLDVRTLDFKPKRVELFNSDGLAKADWSKSMGDGLAMKQVTAGTISMTAAAEGVTPLSNGFRIGADADLNVSGEQVHWVAYE